MAAAATGLRLLTSGERFVAIPIVSFTTGER